MACRELSDEGDLQLAIRELSDFIARTIARGDRANVYLAASMTALGNAQSAAGDKASAIRSIRDAGDMVKSINGDQPSRGSGLRDYSLGLALADLHEFDQAEATLRESVEVLSKAVGADFSQTRFARSAHALILARLGRLEEAETEFHALNTNPATSPREAATIKLRIGVLRNLQKRYGDAELLLRDAMTFFTEDLQQNSSRLALAAASTLLGEALVAQHRAIISIYRTLQPYGSPELTDALEQRARATIGG